MAAIRSKDTAPELFVRRSLHAAGFRFRMHVKNLAGKPDVVLPRFHTAVLVHGCFWHGHDCVDGHVPKSNTDYWQPKIARNQERDRQNADALRSAGWNVVVINECQLKDQVKALIANLMLQRQLKESSTNS